jgi:hypothetical protein
MAGRLQLPSHLSLAELEQRYRRAMDPVARSQWQILWLLSSGMATAEVARVSGYSVNWVREIARRYREEGPTGIGDRRHGIPEAHPCGMERSRSSYGWRWLVRLHTATCGPAARWRPG